MNSDGSRDNDGADGAVPDELEPREYTPRHVSPPMEGAFRVPPEVGRSLERASETHGGLAADS